MKIIGIQKHKEIILKETSQETNIAIINIMIEIDIILTESLSTIIIMIKIKIMLIKSPTITILKIIETTQIIVKIDL
jgi:hypothetical protein